MTSKSLSLNQSGSQSFKLEKNNFSCCFYISEVLKEVYSKAMRKQPINSCKLYLKVILKLNESIQNRSKLLDWLIQVSETLNLNIKTAYQSATIMDVFFQTCNYVALNLSYQEQQQYALASLFIAAKIIEKDDRIPSSQKLMQFLPNKRIDFYQSQHSQNQNRNSSVPLVSCEREILITTSWGFEQYPDFYSILEIFRSQGVVYSSDRITHQVSASQIGASSVNQNTIYLVDKYVEFFSLLCMQDQNFININPYLVCCAILSASRRKAEVIPEWPKELIQLSGLYYHHFKSIEESLIKLYQETFKPEEQESILLPQ